MSTDYSKLRAQIISTFSLEELKTICFDLAETADNIEGSTLDAKARELITYMERRGRLGDLLDALKKARPLIDWPTIKQLAEEGLESTSSAEDSVASSTFTQSSETDPALDKNNETEKTNVSSKPKQHLPSISRRLLVVIIGIITVLAILIIFAWQARNQTPQNTVTTSLPPGDSRLKLSNPPLEVGVFEPMTVTYNDIPIGWHVRGITQSDNGSRYVFNLENPQTIKKEDVTLVIDAYFGDQTLGVGHPYQFFVAASAPGSTEDEFLANQPKASTNQFPPPSENILYSHAITVTRVGPTDNWYVAFFPYYSESKKLGYPAFETTTPTISEQFFIRDWNDWDDTQFQSGPAVDNELPTDHWGVRMVRRIYFEEGREYTFFLEHDDGARLWVDGKLRIDEWDNTSLKRGEATIFLSNGYHEIEIAFYEDTGDAQLAFWIDDPKVIADETSLSTSHWKIEYFPNQEHSGDPIHVDIVNTTSLIKNWHNDNDRIVFGDSTFKQTLLENFSSQASKLHDFEDGLYLFQITGDDSVKLKIDDQVVFDDDKGNAWENCNPCQVLVDISNIPDGSHKLVLEQWQTAGNAGLSLSWKAVEPTWQSISNPYQVETMTVDDNYVWTGGTGGMIQWNKSTLSLENSYQAHTSELPSNAVRELFVDQSGNLWVGTGDHYDLGGSGLARFDGTAWEKFTPETHDLCNDNINSLYQDKDGSIWIGTDEGLTHYNPLENSWHCFGPEDYASEEEYFFIHYPGTMLQDSNGRFWVINGGEGVSVMENGMWHTYSYGEGGEINIPKWSLLTMIEDSQGELWFGSWDGAVHYNGQSWEILTTENSSLPSNAVVALAVSPDGSIWFGTINGLARRTQDGSWGVYNTDNGLASNSISALTIDNAGDLWIAYTEGDISRFIDKPNEQADQWISSHEVEHQLPQISSGFIEDQPPPNRVMSLQGDGDGDIWVGTGFPRGENKVGDGIRLYIPSEHTWRSYVNDVATSDSYIDFIFHDKLTDVLWFGTDINDSGVIRYDEDTWERWTTENSRLNSNGVDDMIRAKDGGLWFATSGGGISRYDEEIKSWRDFTTDTDPETPGNDANTVFEDSRGYFWFGFEEDGLVRFNPEDDNDWITYTLGSETISNDSISDIVEDNQGILWFATRGGGISLYNHSDDTWSAFRQSDGLLSDTIYTLFKDSRGWIWAGTDRGISIYTGNRWLNYTTADGLAARHVWAIWEQGPLEMWLGTNGGISRLTFEPIEN